MFLVLLILVVLILQFFRNPKRNFILNPEQVLSPVDGKVVVIEEVYEKEYFKDKRLQVSVFMSPLNVHVTRYPVGGNIVYSNYHPGKFLVAWHPKSSEENERTTVVVKSEAFGEVLHRQIACNLSVEYLTKSFRLYHHRSSFIFFRRFRMPWHPKSSEENERTTVVVKSEAFGEVLHRQIAGALAKRIVNYATTGQEVSQSSDSGFIKFGSRVDIFLPLGTKINVKLNQKVVGGVTVVAQK